MSIECLIIISQDFVCTKFTMEVITLAVILVVIIAFLLFIICMFFKWRNRQTANMMMAPRPPMMVAQQPMIPMVATHSPPQYTTGVGHVTNYHTSTSNDVNPLFAAGMGFAVGASLAPSHHHHCHSGYGYGHHHHYHSGYDHHHHHHGGGFDFGYGGGGYQHSPIITNAPDHI
eukprot:PhF_6_TR24801/c0_g1_i2/m.34120